MWINKQFFNMIIEDNKRQTEQIAQLRESGAACLKSNLALSSQKAKDDISIDWLRHRVNALEKHNAILLQKAAGVSLPIPEIVPSRPGTMSAPFDAMPSFEDVGDDEAKRLGLGHDSLGFLKFNEDPKANGTAVRPE